MNERCHATKRATMRNGDATAEAMTMDHASRIDCSRDLLLRLEVFGVHHQDNRRCFDELVLCRDDTEYRAKALTTCLAARSPA
jgi:hypothetical protein